MRMTVAVASTGLAVVLMMYAAATILAPRDLAALGTPARYKSSGRMPNLHDSYYTVHRFGVLQVATYGGRSKVSAGPITVPLPESAMAGWPIAVGAILLATASAVLFFRRPNNATTPTNNG